MVELLRDPLGVERFDCCVTCSVQEAHLTADRIEAPHFIEIVTAIFARQFTRSACHFIIRQAHE
ncbi:MAG: hypothetical protein R3B91_11365 [Planctomycetaceae bacterium]